MELTITTIVGVWLFGFVMVCAGILILGDVHCRSAQLAILNLMHEGRGPFSGLYLISRLCDRWHPAVLKVALVQLERCGAIVVTNDTYDFPSCFCRLRIA
jgi:hypothetical protein